MKREQQIEKAALDYCGYDTETIYAHIENAFIAGAEWADNSLLEKIRQVDLSIKSRLAYRYLQ